MQGPTFEELKAAIEVFKRYGVTAKELYECLSKRVKDLDEDFEDEETELRKEI